MTSGLLEGTGKSDMIFNIGMNNGKEGRKLLSTILALAQLEAATTTVRSGGLAVAEKMKVNEWSTYYLPILPETAPIAEVPTTDPPVTDEGVTVEVTRTDDPVTEGATEVAPVVADQ
ncbi:hypothetical protein PIB30_070269, partial [Stylosanthes scabra]|nr:hypothetical protein [Stylosanthes scabra]